MSSLTLPLFLSFCVLLVSPTYSLNCTSQNFKNNKVYANCTDLPSLNSFLHYTYNSTNSSLSIAFVASPAKSGGWTAWGINPNGTGMVGTQALVAFKSGSATAVEVKTYDLVSYRNVTESKLSFDVWDVTAEEDAAAGTYVIFATVKVPEKAAQVNQVWQVGPSVTSGKPDKHEFTPANLQAKATLAFASSSGSTNTTAGGGNTTAGGDKGAGNSIRGLSNVGFCFGVSVLIASFFGL